MTNYDPNQIVVSVDGVELKGFDTEHSREVKMDAVRADEIIEANTTSNIKRINVSNKLNY